MKKLGNLFAVIARLFLSFWAFINLRQHIFQTEARHRFTEGRDLISPPAASNSHPQSKKVAARRYPSTGSAIGMLSIPRLWMSMVVIKDAEKPELELGPGHAYVSGHCGIFALVTQLL